MEALASMITGDISGRMTLEVSQSIGCVSPVVEKRGEIYKDMDGTLIIKLILTITLSLAGVASVSGLLIMFSMSSIVNLRLTIFFLAILGYWTSLSWLFTNISELVVAILESCGL